MKIELTKKQKDVMKKVGAGIALGGLVAAYLVDRDRRAKELAKAAIGFGTDGFIASYWKDPETVIEYLSEGAKHINVDDVHYAEAMADHYLTDMKKFLGK